MQVVIRGGARGLREAEHLDHAPVFIPAPSAGGHQLGKERRIVDVEFVGRDAHDVAVLGVHVADAKQVLAATEVVMVELAPEGHCCEAGAWKFSKRMQSQAVGIEEDYIEGE